MKVGLIKEIKDQEYRVALTPFGAQQLITAGHQVLVEIDAGVGAGFSNQEYQQAGAQLVNVAEAWAVDLVVKVKEPLTCEYQYLNGQIVFTFLHLAGVTKTLTEALLAKGTTAIAYEAVEDAEARLPILAPMSAIAGNMAAVVGSYYLAKFNQGKGMQLGRVLGQRYGKVVVIGDGIVGQHAAQVANAMGANVYLAGTNLERLQALTAHQLPGVNTFLSNSDNISCHLLNADLIIGAVLQRGAKAPTIMTEQMVMAMQEGSVVVDVSIDQGGCVETSVPTSHSAPVFIKHGIVHYCVANMPGAYPRTATLALTAVTLPYILEIAGYGLKAICKNTGLMRAVNTYRGYLTCKQVAIDLDLQKHYKDIDAVIDQAPI